MHNTTPSVVHYSKLLLLYGRHRRPTTGLSCSALLCTKPLGRSNRLTSTPRVFSSWSAPSRNEQAPMRFWKRSRTALEERHCRYFSWSVCRANKFMGHNREGGGRGGFTYKLMKKHVRLDFCCKLMVITNSGKEHKNARYYIFVYYSTYILPYLPPVDEFPLFVQSFQLMYFDLCTQK